MRYLHYHYNSSGTLIFYYRDDDGRQIDMCYMGYSLRDAIQKFREKYELQRKHITVSKLF